MEQTNSDATTLLFARHTDVHNPKDVLYGRLPRFHLSELGFEQAENTARALAEEPISSIYSSPRLRARQTARIIASAHPDAQLRVTRLLDEVLTSWQGHPHSDLEAHGFNFYRHPLQPTDETLDAIWDRLQRFVALARKRHAGQTTLAVTHGDPVMLVRAGYLGFPVEVESIRFPNVYAGKGSITRLVFPAGSSTQTPPVMSYYDPNSHGAPWSTDWVPLEPGKGLVAER